MILHTRKKCSRVGTLGTSIGYSGADLAQSGNRLEPACDGSLSSAEGLHRLVKNRRFVGPLSRHIGIIKEGEEFTLP